MAIPMMEDDVEVISKLGDVPGSDDGLSTAQLKERFDLAGVRIKRFINETLLPHLNQLVDVQALLDGILDATLTASDKAANAKATGDELGRKLDRTGGTMSGILDMGKRKITNLATPTSAMDAANKDYVDTYVGSKHMVKTVTLTVAGWSASAPYKQTVSVPDILASDAPHYGPVLSDTFATAIKEKEAFSVIDDLDTATGSVTFTCLEEKPEVELTIQLEVNR